MAKSKSTKPVTAKAKPKETAKPKAVKKTTLKFSHYLHYASDTHQDQYLTVGDRVKDGAVITLQNAKNTAQVQSDVTLLTKAQVQEGIDKGLIKL